MTLVTRIEKALEGMIKDGTPGGQYVSGFDDGVQSSLARVRQEFAKPPTDEELRHIKTVLNDVFLRHGPFELSGWIDHLDELARAAITADRGK